MWCLSITPSANETSQKGNNGDEGAAAAKEEERTIDSFKRIDGESKSQLEWILVAAMLLFYILFRHLIAIFPPSLSFIQENPMIFQLRNISFKIFHLHSFCHDFLCSCEFFSLLNQYCYVWFTYTFARKINFSLLSWDFRMGTLNKQFLFYHISFLFVLFFAFSIFRNFVYCSEKHKTLSKHWAVILMVAATATAAILL